MVNYKEPKKLLGQSEREYAKFLKHDDIDAFVEAGELLWECFKANIARIADKKTDNINDLMTAASQLGETYLQLFYHCYHFHSWYLGAVPNDFEAEKKLYLQTTKSLKKIIEDTAKTRRTKSREMEKAAEAS